MKSLEGTRRALGWMASLGDCWGGGGGSASGCGVIDWGYRGGNEELVPGTPGPAR